MKKRLTACLLTAAMLCTGAPAAFATRGPQDVPAEPEQAAGGADISTLYGEAAENGIQILSVDDVPAGEEMIVAEVVEDDAGISTHASLPKIDKGEPRVRRFSAPQDTGAGMISEQDKTTSNFTTYGDQLGKVAFKLENGQNIYVGAAMKKMYDNYRRDALKGEGSAAFAGDEAALEKLGVKYRLSGIDMDYYGLIANQVSWLVYQCVDYDTPEMFYSNSSCYALGGEVEGTSDMAYSFIIPAYGAGFRTVIQRKKIKDQLEAKVKEIISEGAAYPRAYDKMKFFHDWLCRNNSYNDDAMASGSYSEEVSDAPWSCASGILSSTNPKVAGPVCEGYARAFALLCHRAGITCTVVTGSGHMWNNLRYDHKWTGVDATWDDDDSGWNYEYFLTKCNGQFGHKLDDDNVEPYIAYPVLSKISSAKELPFYDKLTWQKSALQFVYDNGYMNGLTCVNFGVNQTITRAEFAAILYNIAGKPAVAYTDRFSDIPRGKWYTNAVLWTADQGIASGDKGKFMPNAKITREQIAVMLHNRAGKPEGKGDLSRFADYAKVHSWALNAMVWANGEQIINGKSNKDGLYLDPLTGITRGETAAVFKNMLS